LQIWNFIQHAIAAQEIPEDEALKFLSEIAWREFAHHLLYHNPMMPTEPLRPSFRNFPWRNDRKAFAAWTRGETGVPIVDAGMGELWRTGWMHNRVRMIAASFLVKNLLLPWQWGERWFWDTLVDADPANNAASWQWVAGCGADAAPYFRIFNPVSQGEKFDPGGAYVRAFAPELAALPNNFIHAPWKAAALTTKGYPRPIVELDQTRKRALASYETMKLTGL
jgi:deoxyribodipyrimidine photo-lyase